MAGYNFRWNFLGAMTCIFNVHFNKDYENVCEWGAGYSTFMFSALLQSNAIDRLISVDQFEPYLEEIKKEVSGHTRHHVSLAELFEVDRFDADDPKSLYYTTCPLHFGQKIDMFLIDGRARSECLLVAALSAGADATIILDDCERARYLPALRFFDLIDRQLRFAILKVKPAFAAAFQDFANGLHRFGNAPIMAPKEGRSGGMGHVPTLPDLADSERADLKSLLRQLPNKPRRVVCWSTNAVAETVMAAAASPREGIQIVDRSSKSDKKKRWLVQPALITGRLDDLSRDPNLHYSTAPLADPKGCDLTVIAGHRRNECAITAAFLTEANGHLLIRDADRLHLAPTLGLFDTVTTSGVWTLAKPKQSLAGPLAAERTQLFSETAGREISPPAR